MEQAASKIDSPTNKPLEFYRTLIYCKQSAHTALDKVACIIHVDRDPSYIPHFKLMTHKR